MTTYSRRQLISFLIAAALWTALTVTFMQIPFQEPVKDPDFREIRIQLAPAAEAPKPEPVPEKVPEPVVEEIVAEPIQQTPAVTEAPAAPAPAPTPAPKAAEPAPAPAAPKQAAPAPVTQEAPKQAAPAKTPTPAPEPAKQTLVKSVDQLMAEQNASKGTKKTAADVDWDALFGDSSTATSSTSTGEKTFAATSGSSMSGTAAASSSDSGSAAAASTGKATDSSASETTASALSNIAGAAGSASSGSGSGTRGSASGVTGGTGSSSVVDASGIEWGNGAGRRLVRPSTTEITFTAEQKALITTTISNIRISFKVRKDGTVLRDSIIIDKKASIPAAISQEIERQISEWFFETGTSDGQAVFVYSIIKE